MLTMKPLPGICKSCAVWGRFGDDPAWLPLIYFRRPNWLSEDSFVKIVRNLVLQLPVNFEVQGVEHEEQ